MTVETRVKVLLMSEIIYLPTSIYYNNSPPDGSKLPF